MGALCRHFDFDQEEFKGANKVNTTNIFHLYLQNSFRIHHGWFDNVPCASQIVIKDKVLELLLYFTTHEDEEVQLKAIIGLGMLHVLSWSWREFLP